MEIRQLLESDIGKACSVIESFHFTKPSEQYVGDFLSDRGNLLVAAFNGEQPVGFALAYILHRIDRKDAMMFLYEIGVLAEYRQRGIGKSLINELKRICREKDLVEMFVLSNESNRPAMKLYESTGAERENIDDILMVYAKKAL